MANLGGADRLMSGLSDGSKNRIRVAHLVWEGRNGPSEFSGMPWSMSAGLQRAGCDVIPVSIGNETRSRGVGSFLDSPSSDLSRKLKRLGTRIRDRRDDLFHRTAFRRASKTARATAKITAKALDDIQCDVIFGSGMSSPFAYLNPRVPVIYATDATARLAIGAYPRVAAMGKGRHAAILDLEDRAVSNSDVIVVPCDYTRDSMIADHGARDEQVTIVPFGANVQPDAPVLVPAAPPVNMQLDLLLTAADPERKQLSLAVKIVKELRNRGWNATLHYIGPKHKCCNLEEVAWAGQLRLGDPADSKLHRGLLRSCHLSILPSLGEMYGIAPIESATFGRPAIVSDVGGLPFVVEDGVTGRVLPVETPISGWADAIEAMVVRPERYALFSEAAHRRYLDVLNWDVWGRTVRGLAEKAIQS
jgi:glycosyltransferase involved in cell wall biosynthesis